MQKKHLILILLTACLFPAHAQENEVILKTKIDRDSILIGDPVQWTLQAMVKPPIRIAFPVVDSVFIPGFELLQPQKNDTTKDASGNDVYQTTFIFTSYDAGDYTLPAIPMLAIYANRIDTLFFNEGRLLVKTFDIDTTTFQPFDIKAPIKYPLTFAELLPYIIGIILFLGILAFVIYAIIRWNKHQPLFKKVKTIEPPHVIALRELEKIKKEKLWQHTEKTKTYYTRITDILRNYVEGRYNIPAMEQTSDEIIQSLQGLALSKELLLKLEDMLHTADLVKFAKYTPNLDENEHSLDTTLYFVKETMPVATPVSNNETKEDNTNSEKE